MQNKGLVLVDGAAGFVGQRVVKELIDAGYGVRATDLPGSDLRYAGSLGAEVVYSNLLTPETLEFVTTGIDYVIHCAALFSLTADIGTLRRVNVTGTENLLKALSSRNVKHFVHISTSDIYGTLKTLPGTEDHPQKPINAYATSKKEGEEAVFRYSKELNIPSTIIRPSAIYGPGSIYIAGVFFFWHVVLRFLGLGRYLNIRGGSKLTFTHVDDIAGAIRFVIGRKEAFGEAYNCADEEYMYSADFASMLYKAFGIKGILRFSIPLPHFLLDAYGTLMLWTSGPVLNIVNKWVKKRWAKLQKKFDLSPKFVPHFERQFYSYFIGHRYFSSEKLRQLGYQFKNRSFAQGFPPAFQWYLDNRWLPPIDELSKKM